MSRWQKVELGSIALLGRPEPEPEVVPEEQPEPEPYKPLSPAKMATWESIKSAVARMTYEQLVEKLPILANFEDKHEARCVAIGAFVMVAAGSTLLGTVLRKRKSWYFVRLGEHLGFEQGDTGPLATLAALSCRPPEAEYKKIGTRKPGYLSKAKIAELLEETTGWTIAFS